MSVYYKFSSAATKSDSIAIGGAFISLDDLKAAVLEAKKLGAKGDVDLEVRNAQTGEVYSMDGTFLIPKNTSVIVKRVPVIKDKEQERAEQRAARNVERNAAYEAELAARERAARLQGRDGSSVAAELGRDSTFAVLPAAGSGPPGAALSAAATAGADEESAMAAVLQHARDQYGRKESGPGGAAGPPPRSQPYHGYRPGGGQQSMIDNAGAALARSGGNGGGPPPGFVCSQCKNTGHFPEECPLVKNPELGTIKPATGIPAAFLRPASGAPGQLVLPGGRTAAVTVQEDKFNRMQAAQQGRAGAHDAQQARAQLVQKVEADPSYALPHEIHCPLCKHVMAEATLAVCCGNSFCSACIHKSLLTALSCPVCRDAIPRGPKGLIANRVLRSLIDDLVDGKPIGRQGDVLPEHLHKPAPREQLNRSSHQVTAAPPAPVQQASQASHYGYGGGGGGYGYKRSRSPDYRRHGGGGRRRRR